jgi:hypothetical protein
VSGQVWDEVFHERQEISLLIKNDMLVHRVRAATFVEFLETPNLVTHLLVGLAELNSNASMFGGFDSDSFKAKYKNFDKFGGRALAHTIQKSRFGGA